MIYVLQLENCLPSNFSHHYYTFFQTCPVDLTRTLEHNQKTNLLSSDTESETPKRRLAFSVENILDPNKFTGKKVSASQLHGNRIWSGFERDELDRFDDESESHSGEWTTHQQPKKNIKINRFRVCSPCCTQSNFEILIIYEKLKSTQARGKWRQSSVCGARL